MAPYLNANIDVYMLSYVVNTYKTAGKTYLIKIDEDEYTPNKNTGQ